MTDEDVAFRATVNVLRLSEELDRSRQARTAAATRVRVGKADALATRARALRIVGLSVPEIARVINRTESQVRRLLRRA